MNRRFAYRAAMVCALASAVVAYRSRRSLPAAVDEPSAIFVAAVAPPVGTTARYRVEWSETSVTRAEGAEALGLPPLAEGALALDADLVVSALEARDGHLRVRVSLEDVRRVDVRVLGKELRDADARSAVALGGALDAVIDSDGRLEQLFVPKALPGLTVQLIEGALAQAIVPRVGTASEATEVAPDGAFAVRYVANTDTAERHRVRALSIASLTSKCEAPCAITLTGGASIIREGDRLVSIADEESIVAAIEEAKPLTVVKARFRLDRLSTTKSASLIALADAVTKEPGAPWQSAAEERTLLEARAAGTTMDDLLDGLDTAAGVGLEALPKGWIVRVAAMLALHPEMLGELAIRFEDPALALPGRLFLLDLLAATGTSEAQATLRRVLDGATAKESGARLRLAQRMALVDAPSAETVRYVRERFAQSRAGGDSPMAFAQAHTLGTLAGKSGRTPDAESGLALLREGLKSARTSDERAAYVASLGNAGRREDAALIAPYARDADDSVRRALASALRKTDTPDGRDTLLVLVSDPDPSVQMTALDSIARYSLTDGARARLAAALTQEGLAPESQGRLVTLLADDKAPAVKGALQDLLARTEDKRLQARIRLILDMT